MTIRPGDIIATLDIGESAVRVVVGHKQGGGVEVIGVGTCRAPGRRASETVDMEGLVDAIRMAREDAETMCGCSISEVWTGISSRYVELAERSTIVPLPEGRVTKSAIAAAIHACERQLDDPTRMVLHRVCSWRVDDRAGICDPEGLTGSELELVARIALTPARGINLIKRACEKASLIVAGVMLETFALGTSTLHHQERTRGVVQVDIGESKTSVSIWRQGALVYNAAIDGGGRALTEHVAAVLRTERDEARRVKERFACALSEQVNPNEMVDVSTWTNAKDVVSRLNLAHVMEPALEELFRNVRRQIELSGYSDAAAAGAVLTGGTSLMPGCVTLAGRALGRPVRWGAPRGVAGMVDLVREPTFAVGVGLLVEASRPERVRTFCQVSVPTNKTKWKAAMLRLIERIL